MLVIYMIKSGESLEWVVDQIMSNLIIKKKIRSRTSRTSVTNFQRSIVSNQEYSFNRLKSTGGQSPMRSSVSPLRPHAG